LKKLFEDLDQTIKVHEWKKTQVFEISLIECEKITDKTLNLLMSYLKDWFPELRNLRVNLLKTLLISDKGIEGLGKAIKSNFSKLETLGINFAKCPKVGDLGLQSLAESLGHSLFCLKQFYLIINNLNITDSSLLYLSKLISRRLKNLKKAKFSFFNCNKISVEARVLLFESSNFVPKISVI